MGSISARRVCQVLDNLENILAVELLSAAQAFDYRRPLKSSKLLEVCHSVTRGKIDHAEEDRVFAEDMETARQIIAAGELVDAANQLADQENIDLNGEFHELFGIY